MPGGRPSKLTNDLARRVIDLVDSGHTLASAARAVGISRASLHKYRQRPGPLQDALGTPAMEVPTGPAHCIQCGGPFLSEWGRCYCSDTCRTQRRIDTILAMYRLAVTTGHVRAGMTYFRTLVEYTAGRDGTTCAICAWPVDITLKSGPQGDPEGPSLDHVIPTSQGGPDTLVNLRLTHWVCNRRRSNRGGNEQLRLIG